MEVMSANTKNQTELSDHRSPPCGFDAYLMTGEAIILTKQKIPRLVNGSPKHVSNGTTPALTAPALTAPADQSNTLPATASPAPSVSSISQYTNDIATGSFTADDNVHSSHQLESIIDKKEFIPGFIRVENGNLISHGQSELGNGHVLTEPGAVGSEYCLSPAANSDGGINGCSDSMEDLTVDLNPKSSKTQSVDEPSAIRLAKRLYQLDGFRRSDVSRHLTKNNAFSQKVAEEYLKHFDFTSLALVDAMRKFFTHFALVGETQERERVLSHFTRRFMVCNPLVIDKIRTEDACHTLTCALMLLNTDLHGQNIGRKMTLGEFVENLSDLNDGSNFPKDFLRTCYNSIKQEPFKWAEDDHDVSSSVPTLDDSSTTLPSDLQPMTHPILQAPSLVNPFLDIPSHEATEYKRGFLLRKHCKGPDGTHVPKGKRGWKKFYAILKDMVIFLFKSERGSTTEGNTKVLHIHHALAQVARNYKKKKFTFSLRLADWSEFLFVTSDAAELEDWVNTVNLVAATHSASPLAAAVSSQKIFHRPLLPSSLSQFSVGDQCRLHQERVAEIRKSLLDHEQNPPQRNAKTLSIHSYSLKKNYLQFELQRYLTYAQLLRSKLDEFPDLETNVANSSIGEVEEITSRVVPETTDTAVDTPLHERGPANSPADDLTIVSTTGMYTNLETVTTRL